MQLRLCTLSLSLLLCLPAIAETPKPAPAPPAPAPSAVYRWQKLRLNHIIPADALVALHWNTPTATLPTGVERVYALQSNHSLLLRVTDAGFAEATRLVQTVDLPPAATPAAVPQVRLQVSFISVSKTDIDNLGVIFEPAPVPPSKAELAPQVIQLKTATGNAAFQIYQTLMRQPGMGISLPAAVTADKVAARFGEDTQIPYFISHSSSNPLYTPLIEKKMRRLQTSLSITPRVNSDGSVTLTFVPLDGDLNAPPKAIKVPTAKTVSSGQVVVLTGLPFSKEKQTDDQELLIFVTPTILGSPAAETEAKPSAVPQVSLQADFVGASKVDVDNLGVPFEPALTAPVKGQPAPETAQLRTATGNIVVQLYQTLTRTHSTGVHAPIAVTANNVAAKLTVDSHVSYHPYRSTSSSVGDPKLRETRELTLQASVTITPRINSDGSVTVQIVTQAGDSITRTVPNGQMMVLAGLPLSKEKQTDDQELLVFVTPTVLSSPAAETEAKPPATPIVDTGQPDPPMPGITDTPAEAKRFATIDVYDADMATVAAMFQRQTGLLISLRVGGEPFGNVSVHLEHATPSQVLRAIARSAGAVLTRKADGEYVFAMPTAAPGAEIEPFRRLTPPVYRLHSIAVKHVRASDILAAMHWGAEHQTPFSPLEEIPPPRLFAFPAGVRQVFVVDQTNTLFADATDQGFAEITRTVKELDHGPQVIEFNTLLLAVPTSRRGLDPATSDAAKFLTTLLSGTQRLVWAVPVTAEGGQDISVAVGIRSGTAGFRLSTQRNLDGTLTLRPAFNSISPLAARTVFAGKAAVWEVPNQPLVTGERLFFFVRPTLRLAGVESGDTTTLTP